MPANQTSVAPVRVVSVETDPVTDALFDPQPEGWLGSDVVYSVPLSPTRNFWLFADTWLGKVEEGKRVQEGPFVHSSIGLQDHVDGVTTNVEFFWGKGDGFNRSFFPDSLDASRASETLEQLDAHTHIRPGTPLDKPLMFHWPTLGLLLQGELLIYAYRLETDLLSNVDMPTSLLRVANPLDPPEQWQVSVADMGFGSNEQSFHTAVFVDEPFAYFVGYDRPGQGEDFAVLSRIRTGDILAGKLADAYEFLVEGANGPEWGTKPENLVPLFTPGNTEAGIHYEEEWGLYICTTYRANSPEIYISAAPELTGPWCEPIHVYDVPEHAALSFYIISYAARPHPELSTQPGELVISYATNAPRDLPALFTEEGLRAYRPRFIRVQLERTGA